MESFFIGVTADTSSLSSSKVSSRDPEEATRKLTPSGYWVWQKIVENLAVLGYDTNSMDMAAYDW